MKISDAIRKYRMYYAIGYAMLVGSLLMYLASFLTFVYWQGVELGGVFRILGQLAYKIFAATYPYTSLLWEHALTFNQTDPLSYGNLTFLGLIGVAILGGQIVKVARALHRRVKAEVRRVEEQGWRTQQQGFSTTINAAQVGQINVHNNALPPDPKGGSWMDRPLVKYALGILATYLVAVLVKLTGMA